MPISGAKNSALKLMAACVLAEGRYVLRQVPDARLQVLGDGPYLAELKLETARQRQESQPKTVYHDRVDYTHGTPKKKLAGSSAR